VRGNFSVGSDKEYAHATYRAFGDADDPPGMSIRHLKNLPP